MSVPKNRPFARVFVILLGLTPFVASGGAFSTLVACSSETADIASASASERAQKGPTARPLAPPPVARPAAEPNPLGLPARSLDLAAGARVFAVPEPMLRGAKEGSSMHLRIATVVGKEGENIVLDGRDGPDYSIHPAYVVPLVPGKQRPRIKQPVVAEWAQALRHGVVRRHVKDKIVVRFTDTQDKSDRMLDLAQLMPQSDGFRPGNYAARRVGGDLEHVLLVSPIGGEPKDATQWFTIGYLGAAHVVKTEELVGVPISFEPKAGSAVLVEHLGKMRDAVVKEVDPPGLLTVRFERAGRSVQTGWGLVMPPLAPPH
ncbi:MAG: hypothetical protein HOW73_04230 [Polyangiaceae bacterium]|nr:hypothetical protein [Polyangiaceae bacterium]